MGALRLIAGLMLKHFAKRHVINSAYADAWDDKIAMS